MEATSACRDTDVCGWFLTTNPPQRHLSSAAFSRARVRTSTCGLSLDVSVLLKAPYWISPDLPLTPQREPWKEQVPGHSAQCREGNRKAFFNSSSTCDIKWMISSDPAGGGCEEFSQHQGGHGDNGINNGDGASNAHTEIWITQKGRTPCRCLRMQSQPHAQGHHVCSYPPLPMCALIMSECGIATKQ